MRSPRILSLSLGLALCLSPAAAWAQSNISDAFGYEVDETFAFSWTDISSDGDEHLGTLMENIVYSHWLSAELPWSFPFYGSEYTRVFISRHGGLRFSAHSPLSYPEMAWSSSGFPSDGPSRSDILVWLNDALGTNNAPLEGTCYSYHDPTTDTFIVSWVEIPNACDLNGPHSGCSSQNPVNGATYQAVLHSNGQIDVHLDDIDFGATADLGLGGYVQMGIQNATGRNSSSPAGAILYYSADDSGYGNQTNQTAVSYSLCTDADGDGFAAETCGGTDCDDANADRNPGEVELCDAGTIDEDCDASTQKNDDNDADGESPCGGDCDDTRDFMSSTTVEVCDGYDNDCNGTADFSDASGDELDEDKDGFLECNGFTNHGGSDAFFGGQDCDDASFWRNPGISTEYCDGYDNDCASATFYNGAASEDEFDTDGDGYLDCELANFANFSSSDSIFQGRDCDDGDPDTNPGAPEICDGIDDNCSGDATDENVDSDGDGAAPCAGDCDDTDASLNALDNDGDGATNCTGDCDDGNATVFTGAYELCDTLDTDCDGSDASGESGVDTDGDGLCDEDDLCAGEDDLGLIAPVDLFNNSSGGTTWYTALSGFDFDGNGSNNIIFTSDSEVLVVDQSGQPIAITKPSDASSLWGTAVSAGDFDGDGLDDLVIGDSGFDTGTKSDVGRIQIYLGDSSATVSTTADYTVAGTIASEGLGHAVTMSGDLDGDGNNELVVTLGPTPSQVRLFKGLPNGPVNLAPSFARTYSITGASSANLAIVPSLNGDSDPELVVTQPELALALVIDGGPLLAHGAVLNDEADVELTEPTNVGFGSAIFGLDDINGDGFGDIGFSADPGPNATPNGLLQIYLGSSSGVAEPADHSGLGGASGDAFGASVAAADWNEDGLIDLVVGAPGVGDTGAAYLFLDAESLGADFGPTDAGLVISAGLLGGDPAYNAAVGAAVGAVGDLADADGQELLVGAPGWANSSGGDGRAYVLSPSGYTSDVDGDTIPFICDSCAFDSGNDADSDGYCLGGTDSAGANADCDDANTAVNPSATQSCNGVDDDCSGLPSDEADGDGDGEMGCSGDCDDDNAAVNTSATEACSDGIDNDCDGATDIDDSDCAGDDDDSASGDDDDTGAGDDDDTGAGDDDDDDDSAGVVHGECPDGLDADADGDGFVCSQDCDDNEATVYPGAELICDYFFDTNCDGEFDVEARCDGCACNLDSGEPLPTEALLLLIPFAALGIRRRQEGFFSP